MPYSMHRRRQRTRLFIAILAAGLVGILVGCGGGGGGAALEPPTPLDLGEFSATEPTTVGRTFLNPLDAFAQVTALASTGPIAFDPNSFPATAVAGGPVTLRITFQPEGPGEASTILGLRFTAAGQIADRFFDVKATGEAVPWVLEPASADFGDVLPGDTRTLELGFTNGSSRSIVTLTSATVPPGFSLDPDPFPITVPPGQKATVTVAHAPPSAGTYGGSLRLGPGDAGGPVEITLGGTSSGSGERIIDLGTQTLSNGETPLLQVQVPAEAISLSIEGRMSASAEVGLLMCEGPGSKVYENVSATGPLKWTESRDVFFTHLPSSDRASTQLVPGGGTYSFKLFRVSGSGDTMDVRVHLELRAPGAPSAAVLPLNIFLAQGITPTADTAGANAHLQDVLTKVNQIVGAQNITLGDIDYYDLSSATFDDVSQGEEDQLFQQSTAATKTRLNLFLVKKVWNGNLLGLSGSIDGAKEKGSRVTGVVSIYFDAQAGAIATVIAHEMLHYLGLWHTVESTGVHDEIDDTPECPATGTDANCPTEEGGGLLMHWEGNGGKTFTNGQGLVVRGHPLLHHPTGGQAALRAAPKPWVPDAETIEFFRNAPPGWCGTHR